MTIKVIVSQSESKYINVIQHDNNTALDRARAEAAATSAEASLTTMQGTIIASVAIVGNDIVFTKTNGGTVTLTNAVLTLEGNRGWSPVFAVVADGLRRVLQVSDWTGGEGTKPAVGKYVGATGFEDLIANGLDIRGEQGIQGIQGEPGDITTSVINDLADVNALNPETKHILMRNGVEYVSVLNPIYKKVRNDTGVAIPAGTIVDVRGGSGIHATVQVADKNTFTHVDGITIQELGTVGDARDGLVQMTGFIQESWINTAGFTTGAILYLSTAGGYTDIRPTTGNVIPIGTVGVINAANGSLLLDMPAMEDNTDKKVSKSGDTMTGDLLFSGARSIKTSTADALIFGTNNTERIRITSGGKIGIGESAPSDYITVGFDSNSTNQAIGSLINVFNKNATAGNYASIAFGQGGTGSNSYSRIGVQYVSRTGGSEAQDIFFGTISAGAYGERMRLLANGNLGIGTVSPSTLLTLYKQGLGTLGAELYIQNPSDESLNSSAGITFGITNQATNYRKGGIFYAIASDYVNNGRADIIFAQNNSANGNNATIANAVMTIKPSGNVGIGTTAPVEKLQVTGGRIYASGQGDPVTTGFTTPNHSIWQDAEGSNSGLRIRTGGVDAITFKQGNIGIGTSSPTYKLDISGTTGTVGVRIASNVAGDILYYGTGTVTGDMNLLQSAISATGSVSLNLINSNTVSGSTKANIQVGGASAGDPQLLFTVSGVRNWNMGIDNSDDDKFKISSASTLHTETRLTIDTVGNVGIGTTTPALENNTAIQELTISKTGAVAVSTLNLQGNRTDLNSRYGTINSWNGAVNTTRINFQRQDVDNSGQIAFLTAASGTLVEAMRIDKNGNVGIGVGVNIPTEKLDVIGNIALGSNPSGSRQLKLYGRDSAGSLPIIEYYAGASNPLRISTTINNNDIELNPHGTGNVLIKNADLLFSDAARSIGTSTAHDLIFNTNATERMRIRSNGDVQFVGNIKQQPKYTGTLPDTTAVTVVDLTTVTTTYTAIRVRAFLLEGGNTNVSYLEGFILRSSAGFTYELNKRVVAGANTAHGVLSISGNNLQIAREGAGGSTLYRVTFDTYEA